MSLPLRSFAARCVKILRRFIKKLSKRLAGPLRAPWLWRFFASALDWIGAAWQWLTHWYAPPPRRTRKKSGGYARLPYFRPLRIEPLGARVMLVTTVYTLDLGASVPLSFGTACWKVIDNPNDVAFQNSSGSNISNAVIQGATSATTISVPGDVVAGSISFDSNGPYTLLFPQNAAQPINVTAGTLSFQSNLSIDVGIGTAAVINSAIAGTNNELVTTDTGTLTLTGSVTVAGIQELYGTLALKGTTTITNLDKTGDGLWVQNDATILGSGALTLLDQPDQSTPAPFKYASSSPISEYDGPISGEGGLTVNAGTLTVGSNANVYRGGTYIGCQSNTVTTSPILRLTKGAGGAPSTLGSDDLVTLGLNGTLDLNGCPFTLPWLAEDGSYNKVQNGAEAFWWAGGVNQLAA